MLKKASYKVGDPPPEGYIQWHYWAEVQYNGGLRQTQCLICKKWFFPQEKCDCKEIKL